MAQRKRINEDDLLAELNQIQTADLKTPDQLSPTPKRKAKRTNPRPKKQDGPGRPKALEEYVRASFSIPARQVSTLQYIASKLVLLTGKPVSTSAALRAILDAAEPDQLAKWAAKSIDC